MATKKKNKTESQAAAGGDYNAASLSVLEGLDAVRKRPGMYIGTTDSQGLMHCLWEIIDNSVDEALAGACNHIIVTLHNDGSISVADNGRGIPVDVEPKTGLSGVEVVLTKLHAGGKFGNSAYNAVGGLHGVGSSVVNALSSRLDVEVDRDGKTYRMEFHQGHPGTYDDPDPQNPSPESPFTRTRKNKPTELRMVGKYSGKKTGTRIRYWADPEIFNSTAVFNYEQLIDRVRQTSFLVPGLRIEVIDEKVDDNTYSASVDSQAEREFEATGAQEIVDTEVTDTDADTEISEKPGGIDDFDGSDGSNDDDLAMSALWRSIAIPGCRNSSIKGEWSTSSISSPAGSPSAISGTSKGTAPIRRRPSRSIPTGTCTPPWSKGIVMWTSPCGGSTIMRPSCAPSSTWSKRPGAACMWTASSTP